MKLKVFSIRDSKAQIFNQPWFARTHGEAERNFEQLVRDEKSTIYQYPEDYDLYHIGEYDDETGLVTSLDTPKHVAKAVHLTLASQTKADKALNAVPKQ